MKKSIFTLILAGTIGLSLTGCQKTNRPSADPSPTAAQTPEKTNASEIQDTEKTTENGWEPSSTVSIVVPAGAGGDTDLSARVFAQYAKEITGHDFIVVNSNGAAGSIAANQVLASQPDGHTFLYGHNLVNVANIAGVTDYNYTAFKIGPTFVLEPPTQLYVYADQYANLNEFIEAAKATPGELKACTEVGAYTYYELLAFEKAAGIDLELVDAGSTSDKIAAMLSGQIDLMPAPYINCKDYLESGQFVAIGVPTKERYEVIQQIPTLKEQEIDLVYPNLEFSFYFPKETPDNIILWYENLAKQITENSAAQESIANIDMMPYFQSAAATQEREEEIFTTLKSIADELTN